MLMKIEILFQKLSFSIITIAIMKILSNNMRYQENEILGSTNFMFLGFPVV